MLKMVLYNTLQLPLHSSFTALQCVIATECVSYKPMHLLGYGMVLAIYLHAVANKELGYIQQHVTYALIGEGGKIVRGKCARGSGASPGNSSVPLSKHIYSSVFNGRQEFSLCHYFKLQLGKHFGGSLSVFREVPPSRLNPGYY